MTKYLKSRLVRSVVVTITALKILYHFLKSYITSVQKYRADFLNVYVLLRVPYSLVINHFSC